MNGFLTVFSYTIKENVKKKSFIISTLIILILTVVVMAVPAIMTSFDNKSEKGEAGNGDTSNPNKGVVYIIDSKGIFKNDLPILTKAFSGYSFIYEEESRLENLKEEAKKEKSKTIIVINEKDGLTSFEYYVEKYGSGLPPEALSKVFKNINDTKLLKSANVSQDIAVKLMNEVTFSVNELGKGMLSGYVFGFVLSILLFFAIYFYGYGVAMSVASEKTSRVMELLVTSTRPSIIILGKTAAMGLLGLCQLVVVFMTGFVTYTLSFPGDFKIGGMALDFSGVSPKFIVMMVVYFILGYLLYAMMNAVAGATVSKAEDVNSALMPINMVAVLAFYVAYFSILQSSGNISTIASIVPLSAPFSMPSRLLMGDVPAWQIIASLGSMVIFTAIMAWISIKLYSSAVLHYGKRLKIAELFNMSKTVN